MSMERVWKDQLYQEFARIGKSLSSPKRLEILDLLSHGPKSVDILSKTTGMSTANVSQHLQTLHEARLVRFTKKGTFVIYELADPAVSDFMLSLHSVCEKQLIEIQRLKTEFLQYHASTEPIPLDVLMERMERGEVILLDVRPKDEYETDHIPGAISIPIEQLEKHLSTLPPGKDIVAYCRGPYCLMSAEAVKMMNTKGLSALRLKEGVHEWRQYTEYLQ
jgi:rhodanese-related sulfurtransferase/DNA-binding transcriptional ArsR family regulator